MDIVVISAQFYASVNDNINKCFPVFQSCGCYSDSSAVLLRLILFLPIAFA